MKKLLLIFCLITGFLAQAQLLDLGVKGGFNLPNLKVNDNSNLSSLNTDQGTGFHVGAMLRIKLLTLYIQPEVLYTQTNTDYEFNVTGVSEVNNGIYKMQRIDVPVMVGFKIGPAAIFAGPVASFNIDSPSEIFDNGYNTATWGYQVGAGIKIKKLLAELKYEGPFSSNSESVEYLGESFDLDTRMHMVILSVGIFFGDK